MEGYAPAFEEGTKSIVSVLVICNCQMRRTIMMMSLNVKVMVIVKRLKPDKAKMTIHMLQMTNIMDTITMMNAIMIRNAILKN
ncbi:unnamed protein product [Prunus armeniaca]